MGDSDDENFVTFGSALEPLDEENLPRKKPITVEDQYALDAQGRRRFHGAFTGGFSAGYFNSVGTRDGWRPQQFKSSRSSKAGGVSQRVEDFMDEEDTGEFGIAPTAIRANSDFTDHGRRGTKRERPRQENDGPIPGVPVLKELLKPVKDTVGVSLLKKMGWRPGQGIGPRVTKREKTRTRRNNEKIKIYGCSLPDAAEKISASESEGSADEGDEILFAPDDYEPFRCNPKDNYFGIGYTGLDRRPVLSGHVNLFDTPAFQLQDKNKKLSIRGQAFGVGAFEADDEDIYQRDDMSRYDFSLGPAETAKAKSRWSQKNEAETSKENCLEGFAAAKNRLPRKKMFDPPELPRDFKPFHTPRKSRFYPPIAAPALSEDSRKGLVRRDLNARDRSTLINDSPSPGQNPAELPEAANQNAGISPTRGSQVAHNIISRTLNLQGKDQLEERKQREPEKPKTNAWLDKLTSKSFVSGGVEGSDPNATGNLKNLRDFLGESSAPPSGEIARPFPTDPDKQARFEKFAELKRSGASEKLASLQPLSMTEWERNREAEEFDQAARLFLGERATNPTIAPLVPSNFRSTSDKFVAPGAEVSAPSAATTLEEQMKNAARMKLYGKLTRQREPWQPASLVCKRFNIPEPRTGCAKPENASKNKRYSVFDSLDFGGSSERFERATDTSGSFKEPHLPYEPKPKPSSSSSSANYEAAPTAASSFHFADLEATTEKMRSFEASYEKIFGRESEKNFGRDKESNLESETATPETEKTATTTAEKKDLFKAIFLSSSEDEADEEAADDEEDDSEAVKSLLIGKAPGELNVQRNTSPPRGIFAKLDLDSLTKPGKSEEVSRVGRSSREEKMGKDAEGKDKRKEGDEKSEKKIGEETKDSRVSGEPEVELLPDMYGPVLPSKAPKNADSAGGDEETRDAGIPRTFFKSVVTKVDAAEEKIRGKWVERTRAKKSKKEKHKHKHKQKERGRHKHKKKDKR